MIIKFKAEAFIKFIEARLAAHEGGAGSIVISWDDATFDYIISQKNFQGSSETLGCSRSLNRAVELAISGKKYD